MKKAIIIMFWGLLLTFNLTGCGSQYTCYQCNKSTSKAYYDYYAEKDHVLCEDCARAYWMPLDYKTYRVK